MPVDRKPVPHAQANTVGQSSSRQSDRAFGNTGLDDARASLRVVSISRRPFPAVQHCWECAPQDPFVLRFREQRCLPWLSGRARQGRFRPSGLSWKLRGPISFSTGCSLHVWRGSHPPTRAPVPHRMRPTARLLRQPVRPATRRQSGCQYIRISRRALSLVGERRKTRIAWRATETNCGTPACMRSGALSNVCTGRIRNRQDPGRSIGNTGFGICGSTAAATASK